MEKKKNRRKRKGIPNPTVEEDPGNSFCGYTNETSEQPPLKRPNVWVTGSGQPSTSDANSSGSDTDSEEWQDVEDGNIGETAAQKDDLQGNVLEISVDMAETSQSSRQRSNRNYDWSKEIQFHVNHYNKALQLLLHKVHLLCLIAGALRNNKMCNNPELQARALSQVPINLLPGFSSTSTCTFKLSWLSEFITWFRTSFCVRETASKEPVTPAAEVLHECIEEMSVSKESSKVLVCLTSLRALGLQARLILSLQPIPVKYNMLTKVRVHKRQASQNEHSKKGVITGKGEDHDTNPKSNEQKRKRVGKGSHTATGVNKVPKSGNKKKTRETNLSIGQDTGVLLKAEVPMKASYNLRKASNRQILSSDSEDDCRNNDLLPSTTTELNEWIEIYSPQEKKWMCVDCAGGHINRPDLCEQNATTPICYIIAVDNENSVKDVTNRYASKWMYETEKLRVSPIWWESTLKPYHTELISRDEEEDEQLQKQLQEKPLPTSISEYKNHHLYVLKRHLLKFEALYPESATTLGYCRGEAVYSRDCVHTLHTKETWMKQGLAIRHGEKPYKMVKARQKRNKSQEPLLPLFGQWQTELYIPPPAVDGKVPRNEYGNVELFQPSMLPMGTVHLQIPGLNRVAQKIGVDCAPAMVGWDFHGGVCHPVFDGFVVCKEFTDILLDSWEKENAEREEKLNQKKRIRAEKNWKMLVNGILIRERLHERFQRTLPQTAESEDNIDSWPLNKFNQLNDEEK